MKPYRFGVNVGPSRSRAEWVDKARKLEDLGYAMLNPCRITLPGFLHRCRR
jgi:hypothetical protein